MTTSRTGTARWKLLRTQALHQAQKNGQTHCPLCQVPLNYHRGLHPNSAEPDHIIPHSHGGQDTLENLRIICRKCNQTLGAKQKPKRSNKRKPKHTVTTTKLNHSNIW